LKKQRTTTGLEKRIEKDYEMAETRLKGLEKKLNVHIEEEKYSWGKYTWYWELLLNNYPGKKYPGNRKNC